jgi:hypothetical protein
MAKKQAAKMGDTVEMVRPYLERALRDEEFRKDLKDALQAARELYGPLSKSNGARLRISSGEPSKSSRTLPERSRATRRKVVRAERCSCSQA